MEKKINYADFMEQKRILLEYLQVMITNEDWHGVADLAMDMRELEAKQDVAYKSK
jgi:hypothetical protein